MSLEDALNENTAAIKELSLIMAGIKGTPANDTGNTTDKPQKVPPKGKAKEEPAGKQDSKPAETAMEQAGSTETATSGDAGSTETETSGDAGAGSTKEVDYATEVVPAVTAVAKKFGRDGALEVLKPFGVESAKDLDKSRWQELIDACKAKVDEE